MDTLFTLQNVRKKYPNEAYPVLDLEELSIPRGQLVTILGRSGCGKTTFLKLLSLLDQATDSRPETRFEFHSARSGRSYDYQSLYPARLTPDLFFRKDGLRAQLRRSHFGFLFQEEHLLNQLNVTSNIELPMLLKGIPTVPGREKIRVMLEVLKLDEVTQKGAKSVFELSKGERQRVALLRALLHDPEVLFADEPTGALDPLNSEWIFTVFAHWIDMHPARTVIVVTHSTHLALTHSQTIVVFTKERRQVTVPNVPSTYREAERSGLLTILMNADDPDELAASEERLLALHEEAVDRLNDDE